MCGIAGLCCRDGRPIGEDVVRRMAATLAHRGPDAEGVFIDEEGTPSVGLANRRLAVIDIDGGDQPMSTEDGAFTIVYNGELFNADDVRRELESAGHRFRSYCDTEVLLRGYVQWGEEVLQRLNGMWACAVWDRPRRRLFLARDRLGVKPLVYADTLDGVVFGSEIKALIASGLVQRELNPDALPYYLSFFAVSEPHSLVRGVRRLPAGHYLTIGPDGLRERQYWDCSIPEEEDLGAEEYRERVSALLDDSVRRRLVSDRPLGVLLSAGVDSSLIAALAARHLGDPVRTFTLGFDRPQADERGPAVEMADALGADHTEAVVDLHRGTRKLPDLLEAYDEPGELLLQTHFVCELASQSVTVALSGIGGDELFSAYPTHVVANLLSRLDRIPRALREPALALAGLAPSGRLARAVELAQMAPDERATRRLMHQTDAAVRSDLLAPDVRRSVDLDAPARHLEMHYERARATDPLNRMLYVFVKTFLPDELLRASDAMSMLHSLELRTPFLDYRLVEQAMAIPAKHKMRARTGKLLLRDVGREMLPRPIMTEKKGFSVPLGAWLQGDLKEPVRDLLSGPSIRSRGVFDPQAVESVMRRCLAGEERLVPPVMMLYSFELWAQRWLDGGGHGADPAADSRPLRVESEAPHERPTLSVIIVNWNTRELLRACLESVAHHLAPVEREVIVVDNASSDGSAAMVLAEFPEVRLIGNQENAGFGRANNQAMRVARGAHFLLLNPDTVLTDGSVAELVGRVAREPEVGVAHCKLMLPDGRVQHTAYRFPTVGLTAIESFGLYKLMPRRRAATTLLGGYWDYADERDVDWVAGAFMLMPRAVFDTTGGFDERSFMYGEDLEWCYRIREEGWRIRFYPEATITHFDHASSDQRWDDQERLSVCLRTQRDIVLERQGPAQTSALMTLRLAGAAARLVYYSLRKWQGGARSAAYGDMQRAARQSVRALAPLALSRR